MTTVSNFVHQDIKKSHAPSKPLGRSASYKRSGAWAVKKKNGGKFPVHAKKAKPAPEVRKPLYVKVNSNVNSTVNSTITQHRHVEALTAGCCVAFGAGRCPPLLCR